MFGLVASYLLLVAFGAPHVNKEYLLHSDWSFAVMVLPIMIISFGFHNMVPSLTTYLEGDARRLRLAIIAGSVIPLCIYLAWEWLMLGLVPLEGPGGFLELIDNGGMATELLRKAIGSSWVVEIAQYFAFFAILTSFLGNSLSFVDFLADGLKVKKDRRGKFVLCLLVIAPPFAMALAYPGIFLAALTYAGAFGAVILFGILPALMVWSGRYRCHLQGAKMVPGGKISLVLIIFFAIAVIALQLYDILAVG
jgi:tyrosine-specific transport protein